jgi:hypothetical protein
MIRRGDEFHIGPLRIPVLSNQDGRCEVLPIYGTHAPLGMGCVVNEEILNALAKEPGVSVTYGAQNSTK